eukprot:CFRG2796T1
MSHFSEISTHGNIFDIDVNIQLNAVQKNSVKNTRSESVDGAGKRSKQNILYGKSCSILKFAKLRWGEGAMLSKSLRNANNESTKGLDVQKMTQMSWLYNRRTSLLHILRDQMGLRCFRRFLDSEYASENLTFWLQAESLKTADSRETIRIIAENLLQKFFRRPDAINLDQTTKTKFASLLNSMILKDANDNEDASTSDTDVATRDSSNYPTLESSMHDDKLLDAVQNSVLSLMAMDCFPRFLLSPMCSEYLDLLSTRSAKNPNGESSDSLNELFQFQRQAKKVTKGTPSDDWLTKFISMAYVLPFCITISTRVKTPTDEGTFPLSFVNPEYTRCTGYSHQETVGRNCRFLQGKNTEKESVKYLRDSISKGLKCNICITNYRKNGEEFQNLLSLHPIFDRKGTNIFYVGVQYDVSNVSIVRMAALAPVLSFLSEVTLLRAEETLISSRSGSPANESRDIEKTQYFYGGGTVNNEKSTGNIYMELIGQNVSNNISTAEPTEGGGISIAACAENVRVTIRSIFEYNLPIDPYGKCGARGGAVTFRNVRKYSLVSTEGVPHMCEL